MNIDAMTIEQLMSFSQHQLLTMCDEDFEEWADAIAHRMQRSGSTESVAQIAPEQMVDQLWSQRDSAYEASLKTMQVDIWLLLDVESNNFVGPNEEPVAAMGIACFSAAGARVAARDQRERWDIQCVPVRVVPAITENSRRSTST